MGSSSHVDDSITKKYDIKKRLGKGAYGIVWKAVDRSTNRLVAVKKIFDAFCNQTDAQRTFREIVFLQEFRDHPNIVKLLNIHRASNDKDIYLIFEYMETDLHKVIKRKHILQDLHKRYIMYQLLRATFYIHSGNVIHRDQKPSNILLDSYCRCKVADFGLARSLSHPDGVEGVSGTDPTLTDYVATRWYRAPEILVASKQYTKGIDMWSLGCILAEMLLGRPLFPGSSTINQVERIMGTMEPPTPGDLACVCPGYGSSLFQRAPAGPRVPLPELLRGAPQDGVDLVCRLLVLNPLKRLTAEQALEHPYVARFRRQCPEPALSRPVVPMLRDDVQLSVHEYRAKLYEMYEGGPPSPCSSNSSSGCSSSSGGGGGSSSSSSLSRHKKHQRSLASQGGGDAVAPARGSDSGKQKALTTGSSSGSGSSGTGATLRAPTSTSTKEPAERRHPRQVSSGEETRVRHLLPKRLSVSEPAVAQGIPSLSTAIASSGSRFGLPTRHPAAGRSLPMPLPVPVPIRGHSPRPRHGRQQAPQALGSRRSCHSRLDRLQLQESTPGACRSTRPQVQAQPQPQPQLVTPQRPPCPLGAAPAPYHAAAVSRRCRMAAYPGHGPHPHPGQSCRPRPTPPSAPNLHRLHCQPASILLGAHTVGSVGIISASGLSELRHGYRLRR